MVKRREKVVVAMSGGVDSSVAACLLVEQGYDVMGFFMRVGGPDKSHGATKPRSDKGVEERGGATKRRSNEGAASDFELRTSNLTGSGGPRAHQGCCSASDAADARFVAGMLGIPFYALNFEEEFDGIIDYFADEYARGRTPNPCVVCNDKLKFGRLLEFADAVGAKYIATGHYARIGERDGRRVLRRGADRRKDQSYVLFGLRREVLDRVLFPIGDMEKSEVRNIAAEFNLPNRDKPDSVEICFVPDRNYARVVRQRRPDAFVGGEVVDTGGKVLGRHEGIGNFTVGQRRGLRIAAGRPIYVKQLDVLNQRVVMGDDAELLAEGLIAERVNYLVEGLGETFGAEVKIRYLHEATPATVHRLENGRVRVEFDQPQRAVTPGQAVVFCEGETVLGGGWIEGRIEDAASE